MKKTPAPKARCYPQSAVPKPDSLPPYTAVAEAHDAIRAWARTDPEWHAWSGGRELDEEIVTRWERPLEALATALTEIAAKHGRAEDHSASEHQALEELLGGVGSLAELRQAIGDIVIDAVGRWLLTCLGDENPPLLRLFDTAALLGFLLGQYTRGKRRFLS